MTYATELSAISRTPVTLTVITLDYCSRVYGVGACTATAAAKCFNTFPTCRDRANYARTTKDYKFTSADAPLPFKSGERPYLSEVAYHPTKIETNLTVNARVDLKLYDEDDSDVGIDPYLSDRTPPITGTFWKKMLARNPNYKGRPVKVYEGFAGIAEASFLQTWYGIIDNVRLEKDVITIEAVDILKKMSEIEVPAKQSIAMTQDLTSDITQLTVNSATGIESTGFIRISDEIIGYGARSTVTHIISDCTRGEFGTAPATHKEKDKVQPCRHYAPGDPFTHLLNMLKVDATISTNQINEAAFTSATTWPCAESASCAALISEPMKLSDLFYELVELVDCKVWVAEDLKITIARNLGNRPGRTYTTWTDEAHILYGSGAVNLNEQSRLTRASMYYDKDSTGDDEKPASYARLAVAIDAEAESVNEYGDVLEKKMWCRWLPSSANASTTIDQTAKSWVSRRVMRYRDALPIISLEVERKDSDVKVGEYINLDTDELMQITGIDSTGKYQVVSRDFGMSKTKYELQAMPKRRVGFIGDEAILTQGYSSATEAMKEYGFLTDTAGRMSDDAVGYFIW